MIENTLYVLDYINEWLVTPSGSRAIVFGALACLSLTQVFKKLVFIVWVKSEDEQERIVRKFTTAGFALATGFITTFFLWPGTATVGFFAALITGAGTPFVYGIFDAWASERWNWWKKRVSCTGGRR